MNQLNQLLDALERVLAWELPDEHLADALSTQVGLMAGVDPEDIWERPSEYPFL